MILPSNRFPLAILMGFIGVIAVGLGLMRNGSDLAARAVFNALVVALMIALLGAIVRRGDGAWVGFALFGWAYGVWMLVPAVMAEGERRLLTSDLLDQVVDRLIPGPGPQPAPPTFSTGYVFKLRDWKRDLLRDSSFDFPEPKTLVSPGEFPLIQAHIAKLDAHERLQDDWKDSVANATDIGHSLFAFVAALIGAVLGRALSRRRPPTTRSLESRPSAQLG